MFSLNKGDYPNFQVTKIGLPFSDADVGKRFEIVGTVKLDAITAEGPTFTFEVLEVEFPEKEQGTLRARKAKRQLQAGGVTINVQG